MVLCVKPKLAIDLGKENPSPKQKYGTKATLKICLPELRGDSLHGQQHGPFSRTPLRWRQGGVPGPRSRSERPPPAGGPRAGRRRLRGRGAKAGGNPRGGHTGTGPSRAERSRAGPGLGTGGPGEAGRVAGSAAMRAAWVLLPALAALSAYYIYLPLPGTVSDAWKLMLLDATFRAVQQTVRRPRGCGGDGPRGRRGQAASGGAGPGGRVCPSGTAGAGTPPAGGLLGGLRGVLRAGCRPAGKKEL